MRPITVAMSVVYFILLAPVWAVLRFLRRSFYASADRTTWRSREQSEPTPTNMRRPY